MLGPLWSEPEASGVHFSLSDTISFLFLFILCLLEFSSPLLPLKCQRLSPGGSSSKPFCLLLNTFWRFWSFRIPMRASEDPHPSHNAKWWSKRKGFQFREGLPDWGARWMEMMGHWPERRTAYWAASPQHFHTHLLRKNCTENKVSGGKGKNKSILCGKSDLFPSIIFCRKKKFKCTNDFLRTIWLYECDQFAFILNLILIIHMFKLVVLLCKIVDYEIVC